MSRCLRRFINAERSHLVTISVQAAYACARNMFLPISAKLLHKLCVHMQPVLCVLSLEKLTYLPDRHAIARQTHHCKKQMCGTDHSNRILVEPKPSKTSIKYRRRVRNDVLSLSLSHAKTFCCFVLAIMIPIATDHHALKKNALRKSQIG